MLEHNYLSKTSLTIHTTLQHPKQILSSLPFQSLKMKNIKPIVWTNILNNPKFICKISFAKHNLAILRNLMIWTCKKIWLIKTLNLIWAHFWKSMGIMLSNSCKTKKLMAVRETVCSKHRMRSIYLCLQKAHFTISKREILLKWIAISLYDLFLAHLTRDKKLSTDVHRL